MSRTWTLYNIVTNQCQLNKKSKINSIIQSWGLPRWLRSKEPACQSRRCGFNPWVGKIPWRRAWQPTPVFLPAESPWTEKPGGLQPMGFQSVKHNWVFTHTHTHIQCSLEQIFRIIFLLYFYSEIQLVFYTSSIPVSSEVQYCSLGRKQNVHF